MTKVSVNGITERIAHFIFERLDIPEEEFDLDENLGSFGLSSMQAVHLIGSLEEWLGFRLAPALVYQYPTVNELAREIYERYLAAPKRLDEVDKDTVVRDVFASCYDAVSHLSVIEALSLRSSVHSDRILFRFLDEQGHEEDSITYGELWRRVKILAVQLRACGGTGDRIALFYPAGLDFIVAFLACLLVGRVAVPLNMPTKRRVERCARILNDCDCRLALSLEAIIPSLRDIFSEGSDGLEWMSTDFVRGVLGDPDKGAPLPAADNTLAFLQYTSGSTSHPKGVQVTQQNISTNLRMMRSAWRLDHESTTVFWQPHHHDMGLILGQLLPIMLGNETILMGPNTFVRQPLIWLEAIARYRAVLAGGPNFAYDLCVQRYGDGKLEGCDLSSWKIALNGADVVRASTLERFFNTFNPLGYSAETMLPCYGLAEATLFVSGGPVDEIPIVISVDSYALEHQGRVQPATGDGARTIVSCGLPSDEVEIAIVDPETFEHKKSDEIGEIWVAGATNAIEYWNLPEQSKLKLQAQIVGSPGKFYMRTGDIGFVGRQDGHIYICGRLKDLIIVEGRNIHPEDVEYSIVECDPLIKPQSCAVFEDDKARIIAVIEADRELKRKLPELEKALRLKIRRTVSEEHGISIATVVFIAPATMCKTTSGKIQRGLMNVRYCANELSLIDQAVEA